MKQISGKPVLILVLVEVPIGVNSRKSVLTFLFQVLILVLVEVPIGADTELNIKPLKR